MYLSQESVEELDKLLNEPPFRSVKDATVRYRRVFANPTGNNPKLFMSYGPNGVNIYASVLFYLPEKIKEVLAERFDQANFLEQKVLDEVDKQINN
jgi:hypothetical protein